MRTYNFNSLSKTCFANEIVTDKAFRNQIKKVEESLFGKPKTMLMVSNETGMSVRKVYWYVIVLRHSNRIAIAKIDLCNISKNRSTYLTTDPRLFPMSNHLKSVDDGK